jgi:hypothetical protein
MNFNNRCVQKILRLRHDQPDTDGTGFTGRHQIAAAFHEPMWEILLHGRFKTCGGANERTSVQLSTLLRGGHFKPTNPAGVTRHRPEKSSTTSSCGERGLSKAARNGSKPSALILAGMARCMVEL